MGLTFRQYIFAEDGALKRVPRRICEGLPFGKDAIPEYAGTRQRVAQVLVENEDRRPARILDATGHYWKFDAEGRIDHGLQESMGDWLDIAFSDPKPPKGKVVDLVPEIKKKQIYARDRWELTNEDLDRISADIWPGVHGPAPEVTAVKGKAPKKPPLSYEAKHALREIGDKLEMIKYELRRLSEHSLKGLEFEALRTAGFEDETLWCGVAAEAKLQREIRAAYRTGKGEWYAVVEAYRTDDPIVETTVSTAHEKCKTQKEAIEAGRRLMAEKAGLLSPDTRIEVTICSALELGSHGD